MSGGSQVRLGSTDSFTATVTNLSNTAVTWQVNGVAGGNSTVGTISSCGRLHASRRTIPANNTVTVTAVSVASPQHFRLRAGEHSQSRFHPIIGGRGIAGFRNQLLTRGGRRELCDRRADSGRGCQCNDDVCVRDRIAGHGDRSRSGTTTLSVQRNESKPRRRSLKRGERDNLSDHRVRRRRGCWIRPHSVLRSLQSSQVQSTGVDAWITQQFNTPDTPLANIPTPLPAVCLAANTPTNCEESEWWQTVLTGPDQLRQRVAFALSEIFVISSDTDNATTITYYHNTLAQDAFTNFYTIMNDVSRFAGHGRIPEHAQQRQGAGRRNS